MNVDLKVVSVPFPGILFLNTEMLKLEGLKSKVSVPFPGILFLNEIREAVKAYKDDTFPSPSRGSYFSIIPDFMFKTAFTSGFRPLPGDLISQLDS